MKKIISMLTVLAMLLTMLANVPVFAAEAAVSGYSKLSYKDSNAVVYKSKTTKLTADEAAAQVKMPVSSGGTAWGPSMVRWSNVELNQGISAMSLYAGGTKGSASTAQWSLWIVPADKDVYWNDTTNDFASGYAVRSNDAIGIEGASSNSNAWKEGTNGTHTLSWAEEKISTPIRWRGTTENMSKCCGTYNVYLIVWNCDFYGMEFAPQPPKDGLNWISTNDAVGHGTASDKGTCEAGGTTPVTSYKGMVEFKNVSLSHDGVSKLYINLAQKASDVGNSAPTVEVRIVARNADGSNKYTNADGTWKEGYSVSWMTGYTDGKANCPSNFFKTYTAADCTSWSSYVLEMDLSDNGAIYKGTYDIFVRTNYEANLYGIKFESRPALVATNQILAMDYDLIYPAKNAATATYSSGNKNIAFSNNKGGVLFKDVDFGEKGVSSFTVNWAAGKTDYNKTLSVYIAPEGHNLLDEDGNISSAYTPEGDGYIYKAGTSNKVYTASITTSAENPFGGWNANSALTVDIPNGNTFTGKHDVFITMGYGDFYGFSFTEYVQPPEPEKDGLEWISVKDAYCYGTAADRNITAMNGDVVTSQKGLVEFKNVNFGEKGIDGISAQVTSEFQTTVELRIVPRNADGSNQYTNADGTWKEGYSAGWMTGRTDGVANFPSTYWNIFAADKMGNWNYANVVSWDLTGGDKYTGSYDVFISTSPNANLVSIKFDEYNLSATNFISAAEYNLIYPVKGNTAATYDSTNNKIAFSSNRGGVLFKDVDFGEIGVDTFTVNWAGGKSDYNKTLSVYIAPEGHSLLDEDGNISSAYTSEGDGYIYTTGTTNKNYTAAITTSAENPFGGWNSSSAFTVDIPYGNRYTGKHDVFISMNYGDFYGISFNECELIDGTDPFGDDTDVNIVYIGGSITEGVAGDVAETDRWATITGDYIAEKFAKDGRTFTTHNVAIGGTGSDYGLLRIQKDVMEKNPDMVFVEFAVNDAGSTAGLYQMETIVRTLQTMEKPPYISFIYTTTNKMNSAFSKYHNEIATAYDIAEIDIRAAIEDEGDEFVNDYVNTDKYLVDGVHPNAAGHAFYAEVIKKALNYKDAYTKAAALEEPVSEDSRIVDIEEISIDEYTITGEEGVDYKIEDGRVYLYTDGTSITYKSSGDLIGFMEYKFKEGGYYSISINGRELHEEDEYLDNYIADYAHPEAYLYMTLPYRESFDVTITKLSKKNAKLEGDSTVIIGKAFKNNTVSDNAVEYLPEEGMNVESDFTVINSSDRDVDLVYKGVVEDTTSGTYVKYANVDLTNIANYNIITARIAAAESTGKIKIVADAVDGTLLAEIDPANLDNWNILSRISGAITDEGLALTGTHDIYVVFDGDNACKFEGFKFSNSTSLEDLGQFDPSNYSELYSVGFENGGFGGFNTTSDWICWNDVDFGSESKARTLTISYGTKTYYNGVIQIRLDSTAGPVVAQMPIKYQDGIDWLAPVTLEVPVTEDVTGVHTVYVTLGTTEYMTMAAPAANIYSMTFNDAQGYATNYITLGDTDTVEPKEILNSLTFTKDEDTPDTIVFATAIYDANGKMVDSKTETIVVADGMNVAEQAIVLPTAAGEYTVKGFIWEGGKVSPITDKAPVLDTITITAE